jgi:hypothetical protein
MSRFMLSSQTGKAKEENNASSPAATSKDAEDDQHLSILSKHKINSLDRCPSIILEESENLLQTSSTNKNLSHIHNKCNDKSPKNSQPSITYLTSLTQTSPNMYEDLI